MEWAMYWIKHRVNRIAELSSLDQTWGAEVDLRSVVDKSGVLHLSHDPWNMGDNFEDWLKEFSRLGLRGPLILNTKEDGLESHALKLMKQYNISNFFFLDTALPTLVRWTLRENLSCFALRLSVYEPIEQLEAFKSKAQWIWVDCFDGKPLSVSIVKQLKEYFKICLVSPELQGQSKEKIKDFSELFAIADAVCTKVPEAW
jgi:hypothetical protein